MKYLTILILVTLITLLSAGKSSAQSVGINNPSPAPSAMLDVTSTSKGMLIPRMTSVQRLAISSPATGLLVYETTTNQFFYFDGTIWKPFSSNTSGWNVTGNTGTIAGTNFIGTTDPRDLVIKTTNFERLRVTASGDVGIGTFPLPPSAKLHVADFTTGIIPNPNAIAILEKAGNGYLQFLTPSTDESGLLFGTNSGSARGGIVFNNTVLTEGLQFRTGGTTRMSLSSGGNLGIGTTAPADELHVVGNIRMVDGAQGSGKVLTSDANGTASWQNLPVGAAAWGLSGNAGTSATTNFIGTTDNTALNFKVNNLPAGHIGTNPGSNSVCLGLNSGLNGTGTGSSFFGAHTGISMTTGTNNTFIGVSAGRNNSSGSNNTFVGSDVGLANTTGTKNVVMGSEATLGSANLTNATAIGAEARVDTSNAMVLGSIAGINGAASSVNVGIGITKPRTTLDVGGAITLRSAAPVTFIANITPLFIDNASYGRASSNSTPANRLLVFNDGVQAGQIFILECTATGSNGFRIVDNAAVNNTNVGGNRDMTSGDIITFLWNGSEWLELNFSDN